MFQNNWTEHVSLWKRKLVLPSLLPHPTWPLSLQALSAESEMYGRNESQVHTCRLGMVKATFREFR